MTALGLFTYKEPLQNTEEYPDLITELEIVNCSVKINSKNSDAYISPVWIKTSENNNELNHTYVYENLKVIHPPLIPSLYIQRQNKLGTLEPFVIIMEDRTMNPYNPLRQIPLLDNFYFNYFVIRSLQYGLPLLYARLWDPYLDSCKGIILYDFNEQEHDMSIHKNQNRIPLLYINGSDGHKILADLDNTRVDFTLTQHLNTSVISANVIGQINGTDPTKTVIVDCLYDSWWTQGTADSAIGMAIVLGVAKYFKEHNITPKYTLKFIGFSGEEHGFCAGAKYYASTHSDEEIIYMIDLNQLGFKQDDPLLVLNIISNKLGFLHTMRTLLEQSNYEHRVNSSKDMEYVWLKNGIPSDPLPFATSHPDCKVICFVKDGGWKLHHRDGVNHREGDVLKYFNPEDVNVTGEMVLNVVKYVATEW
jgi:hypothetical protein